MSGAVHQSSLCANERFLAHAELGLAHVSAEGRIVDCNDVLASLFGADRDSLTGSLITEWGAPKLAPEIIAHLDRHADARIVLEQAAPAGTGGETLSIHVSACEDRRGEYHCMVRRSASATILADVGRLLLRLADESGEVFFRKLILHLCERLDFDFGFVGERDGEWIRTVVLCDRKGQIDNIRYALDGTPCATIVESSARAYPASVAALFPDDLDLATLGIESYAATRLFGSSRRPIGLLVLLGRKPIATTSFVTAALDMVAPRVSAELERLKSRVTIAAMDHAPHVQQRVGSWYLETTSGTLTLSSDARIICGVRQDATPTLRSVLRNIATGRSAMVHAAVEGLRRASAFDLVAEAVAPLSGHRIIQIHGETSDGDPTRIHGTIHDVTERTAVRERVRLLSAAIEQTSDSVFITDRAGFIEYANPAFEKATGYSRDEIAGKHRAMLRADTEEGLLADSTANWRNEGSTRRVKTLTRRKSGTTYLESRTITPIRDDTGNVTHYISLGNDITDKEESERDRRRFEEALRQAATEWRTTFDAIASPIVVLDSAWRVRRMNRAAHELLQERGFSMIGEEFSRVPGEPWEMIATQLSSTTPDALPLSFEVKDAAARRTWDVTVDLSCNGDFPGVTAYIIVARDTTRTAELQESLRRSETMSAMGTLIGGVAHEVRNPLFAISATLDALDTATHGEARIGRYVSVLRRETDRLTSIMNDLLQFGRPRLLERRIVHFGQLVQSAISQCAAVAGKSRVTIENGVDAAFGEAEIDPEQIEQLLRNVIENAIQHTPEEGIVTVVASKEIRANEEWLVCSVTDSGRGFAREDLPRVFEPFFTRRRGGTGLGLSIVQRILEQHGGSVRAENAQRGGGVVTVALPVRHRE